MSTYFEQLSRATAFTSHAPWTDGRCGGTKLRCEWTGGAGAAWITVQGQLDDSTAHRLAEALRAVNTASLRVVDLTDVELGPGGMALPLAVLRSPRLVLKDPPDGLLEMLDTSAEKCHAG